MGVDGFDPVVASSFPTEAAALLTCRMDARLRGSSTGPWLLSQRKGKLAFWWKRGLEGNWARIVAMQWVGWVWVRDREGNWRVVVGQLEEGQSASVVEVEELQEGEEGGEGGEGAGESGE